MIQALLDQRVILGLLIALAVLTPLAGFILWTSRKTWQGRTLLAVSLAGPVILLLWGLHNLVLALVGFDSVFSALILLALFSALGWATGLWISRDPRRSSAPD